MEHQVENDNEMETGLYNSGKITSIFIPNTKP